MAVFWFMMRIAMAAGCATALPAGDWRIRIGWKEKMPPPAARPGAAALPDALPRLPAC